MNARNKNLAVAGGAVILIGIAGTNLLMAPPAPSPAEPFPAASAEPAPGPSGVAGIAEGAPGVPSGEAETLSAETSTEVTAAEAGGSVVAPVAATNASRRSYALGLEDLAGLPRDAAQGLRLELWVTWEPPLTRGPRLQKLIGDAVLDRIVPGTVPEAPVSVLLSVPADRIGDLIYADQYGRLSAVLP